MDVHSGPTPRGRIESEDRVSAAHRMTTPKERSSTVAETVMIGSKRLETSSLFHLDQVVVKYSFFTDPTFEQLMPSLLRGLTQ